MDGCMGGFFIPFMKELGFEFPDANFEAMPGLTSISADTHKVNVQLQGSILLPVSQGRSQTWLNKMMGRQKILLYFEQNPIVHIFLAV